MNAAKNNNKVFTDFLDMSLAELLVVLLREKRALMDMRLRKVFLKPNELAQIKSGRRKIAQIKTAISLKRKG